MSPLDEEYETLTRELRGLNTRLGLPEDDGIPQASSLNAEYEELMRENAALDQRLSSLPETFEEFTVRRQKEKERPLTEDITAFGSTLGEGAGMIAGQAKDFASELIKRGLPVFTAGKVAADTGYVGGHDFARIAKTIGGAVMDKAYSEDEEIQREYERYLQNHDYNTKVRPAMLDKVENRAITEFGSNFVDPLMAFPLAGVASKMGSVTAKGLQKAATAGAMATRSQGLVKTAKAAEGVAKGLGTTAKAIEKTGEVMALPTKLAARAGRKALKGAALGGSLAAKGVALAGETTAKVAGTPRKLIAAAAAKVVPADMKNLAGASAFGGQLVGAMTGAVPGAAQLGIAEAAGFVAGKVGREVGYALDALSKRGGNGRFLYRLATNEAAAVTVRRAAMWAYTHAGTRLGDAAFNMAVNGASVGALNAALAWAADEPAEGMGAAAGAGALMGGVMPFGQPGLKGGKSQGARDAASIKNHIRNKVVADQRASFLKMPKASQVMIATLHEANVGAPKVVVLPKDVYLETFPDTSANYSKQERTIYVNEGRLKRGSQQAVELMAHEVGHDFVHQSLGNDPAMLRMLLEPYETTADKGEAFYFQFDKEGNPIGEPIYLDETASAIRTDYDRRFPQGEGGIGTNASILAQEIGADQFSMMFSENPNAFENFHPRLRRHLIDGLRRFLTKTGQAEPLTGNPLTNTVSKQLHRNPAIARLYRNYGKARSLELIEKGNQAEAGLIIEPRKGQTGEDRFTELFGGVGLSLTDAKSLSVSNKTLLRELLAIQERYKDDDAPQGWSVTERGGHLTGKELPDELRTIFTRSDRWGNVANLLDALQEAISQRIGIRFGYRSGTKGKYQNPFKIRDVGIYGWQVSPMRISGNKTRPSLKVLGYDEAKVRHNIQVLVEKGYVKDPQKFMADFAAQAQKALDDPEGRINPEGRKENELFTVAFGLKESADQIASPGLKELLDSKAVKKTFVSYDVEALAGLAKGRDSAFVFDYNNIRENYSPFFSTKEFMPQGDNLYMPTKIQEGSAGSPFKSKTSRDKAAKTMTFKNPVWLSDGSRLSGVGDNSSQDPFYGFDKNGQEFSQQRQYINPSDIVGSRDSDRTANLIRKELQETPDALYLPPMEEGQIASLHDLVKENPDGFTVTLKNIWADKGYVVAPEKRTEKFITAEKFTQKALEDYIYQHEDMFDREGAYLGGWYDTNKNRYVLDVSFPLPDYRDAVNTALWGDQDGIFDLQTFETIRTKDTNERPTLPEGFREEYGESLQDILKRKPDSNAAFAEESWRRSQGVRQEGGEGVRERAGGDEGQTGQPQDASTSGGVDDGRLYMPALEDAKALVEQQGRVAEAAEEVFFGAFMPKILKKTKGQLKVSARNIREAARRGIKDVLPFLAENPRFADYYNKDMAATRGELEGYYENVSDDDFLFYRTSLGLTSPGTALPSNVGDGVNVMNLYKQKGNLDDIVLGLSPKGNMVIESSPFQVSGTTAPTKARSLKVVDQLRKEKGGVKAAIDFLEQGVTDKELHAFNRKMGYKGNVAKIGDIRRIVKAATGQDKLIPRMFIFGPKVGAYTLNAIGRHNYNTIDVWEARFIRSYFKGMFDQNTGLPANVDEHALMTRFTELFQEEFANMTGQKLETSALQASRWFYMIDTAKRLGYSGASTNETISNYTKRYLSRLGSNPQSGGQSPSKANAGVRPQVEGSKAQASRQTKPPPKVDRFLPGREKVAPKGNRFMAGGR